MKRCKAVFLSDIKQKRWIVFYKQLADCKQREKKNLQRFPLIFRGDFLFIAVKLKLKIMKRFLALSAGGGPMSRRFVGVQMKAFMMRDATQTYFL